MQHAEPNILLIVCDTLRKDVLKAYGGKADTPAINSLAKESMVYKNAIAPSSWTFPSHVSLFTGLYPSEHGVHEHERLDPFRIIELNRRLDSEKLPQYLKDRGYSTVGISNNAWVSALTGFESGFDALFSLDTLPRWITESFNDAQQYGSSKLQVLMKTIGGGNIDAFKKYANAWYKKRLIDAGYGYPLDKGCSVTTNMMINNSWKPKFFKFLNFVEVHEPYIGESERLRWTTQIGLEKTPEQTAAKLKEEYIRELEYLDGHLGAIFETMKGVGCYDDTMIILTSDHGQAFNEHGFMYHGSYLYDEITDIPLIIKYPNGKRYQSREGYQSLVNVFDFIKDIVDGGDDRALTTKTAYAESYGFSHALPIRYREKGSEIKKEFTEERMSIYRDGFKMTFNIATQEVEEFLSKGKRADQNKHTAVAKQLLQELSKRA